MSGRDTGQKWRAGLDWERGGVRCYSIEERSPGVIQEGGEKTDEASWQPRWSVVVGGCELSLQHVLCGDRQSRWGGGVRAERGKPWGSIVPAEGLAAADVPR